MSYSRAYGRALRGLRDLHREEFDELLADELEGVRLEATEERALAAGEEPPRRPTAVVHIAEPPPRVILVPVEPRHRA